MALPPLASADDLSTWLGVTFSDLDRARATALLAATSTLARVTAQQTWVDDTGHLVADIPDIAVVIVTQAAARVWPNPTGVASTGVGMATASFGKPYLLDDEKELLEQLRSTSSGLWALPITRGHLEMTLPPFWDTVEVPVDPDGEPMAWGGQVP